MIPFARVAVATLAVGALTAPANGVTAMFPSVTGRNLNGATVQLPRDFQAPASIVYVAFVRGQQAQVDTWKPFVAGLRRRIPAIGEYEVPTLSRGNALFRGFIDGGMRNGITDPAARAATITLYIDKRPFDAALGIANEDAIAVVLVTPGGNVLWSGRGAFDDAQGNALAAAAAAL
jgi:hypothetical protein